MHIFLEDTELARTHGNSLPKNEVVRNEKKEPKTLEFLPQNQTPLDELLPFSLSLFFPLALLPSFSSLILFSPILFYLARLTEADKRMTDMTLHYHTEQYTVQSYLVKKKASSTRMHLLHPHRTLIQAAIDRRRNGQGPSDHGAHARQESREGLGSLLPVDHLHRRDVIVEEDARDTALGVETLLVALRGVAAAHEGALVRGHRVLVRLDAAVGAVDGAVLAQGCLVVEGVDGRGEERVPSEGQVGGRDDLDEVHEVVGRFVSHLFGAVERVRVVVVGPFPAARELIGQLGAESELVDLVRHGVFLVIGQFRVEVVVEIVRVDVARCEASSGRDVEVPDHLVHADDALESAALFALGVDPLCVSFPFTLLDVLTLAKGPLADRVGFADLVAGVAAAGFRGVWGRRGSAAFAAVVGIEVLGALGFRMAGRSLMSVSLIDLFN